MNPYEADPEKIPENDRYIGEPMYGRYHPCPGDFTPDQKYISFVEAQSVETRSVEAQSIKYWESILLLCTPDVRIYDNEDGGRDVFALGRIIVKSSHLKHTLQGRRSERDYSFADANEVRAVAQVADVLKHTGIQVPYIFFAGKIKGRDVLVQSRIPGVGLNVAWQYLSATQKRDFKSQARGFLRRVHALHSPYSKPSYIVPDEDPVKHRGIQELERRILFDTEEHSDLHLMHNDFTPSNIIVNEDKIVGVIDWEMAGYFGWQRARGVHTQIRTPKSENFRNLDLPTEQLEDILYWNNLYDIDPASCTPETLA